MVFHTSSPLLDSTDVRLGKPWQDSRTLFLPAHKKRQDQENVTKKQDIIPAHKKRQDQKNMTTRDKKQDIILAHKQRR